MNATATRAHRSSSTVVVDIDVMVSTRDCHRLATNVYRLDDGTRRPALVTRLPYGKDVSATVAHPSMPDPLSLATGGYVVVVQDVRGTGRSSGTFDPMVHEGRDGADTIEWVVRQPWCDGRVATYGSSYLGMAQWLTAAERPPALHAIAPVLTSPDPFSAPWYHNGVFNLHTSLCWSLAMAASRANRHETDYDGEIRDALAQAAFDTSAVERRLPLCDQPLLERHAPWYRQWLHERTRADFWNSVSALPSFADIDTPALHIAGWYDIFLGPALDAYQQMRAHHSLASHQRLLIGPWSHANLTGSFRDRSFGRFSSIQGQDITGRHLRFFDSAFGRAVDDHEAPVRIFVMGDDVWRDESDWPPPDVRYVPYFLSSSGHANTAEGDGVLGTRPQARDGSDRIRFDPRTPVPSVGGAVIGVSAAHPSGPADQSEVERLDSVLCYTSAPLTRPVEVTGPLTLIVCLSSTGRDTDVTAKLVDVFPDGRAINLAEGITRCRNRLRHAPGSRPLEPGRIAEIEVDLWATSNVFKVGHRIRLEVSASNFPRFDRNPNSGGDIDTATDADFVEVVNTIHLGPRHPSRLMLPLIDRRSSRGRGSRE